MQMIIFKRGWDCFQPGQDHQKIIHSATHLLNNLLIYKLCSKLYRKGLLLIYQLIQSGLVNENTFQI